MEARHGQLERTITELEAVLDDRQSELVDLRKVPVLPGPLNVTRMPLLVLLLLLVLVL